jgi:hypothetical protein
MPSEGACPEGEDVADPGPVRRLSDAQYASTVRDLGTRFGVDLGAVRTPFPAHTDATFSTSFRSNTVSGETALALQERAESISGAMVGDLPGLLGCDPSGGVADPCIAGFVERFALQAFRRPPLEGEITSLTSLYDELVPVLGASDATRAIIEAALQSPLFVYIDGGPALAPGSPRQPFDAYTLASRLSYFLWDTMPDPELFAAAGSGALLEEGGLRAQIDRMLGDPRAAPVMRSFHREWLRLASASTIRPSPELHPSWTATLAESAVEETGRFIDATLWERSGSLADLLTSPSATVDREIASLYGIDFAADAAAPDGWARADLASDRRGILTRVHFLASHRTILRGVVTLDRLLCTPLAAPDDVNTTLPTPEPGAPPATPRERLALHSADDRCRSCHQMIDPIGFSFEHYGADGAFRDRFADVDLPVDASGVLEIPIEAEFSSATELMDRFASEPAVHACYAERMTEWAVGRVLLRSERCSVTSLSQASAPLAVRDLIAAIAGSDLLRMHAASTEE